MLKVAELWRTSDERAVNLHSKRDAQSNVPAAAELSTEAGASTKKRASKRSGESGLG